MVSFPLFLRLALCAGILASLSPVAMAEMPPAGMPAPSEATPPAVPAPGLPPFLRGIHLSDAQQDQLFDIEYRQMRQVRDYLKTIRKADEALRSMGMAVTFDEAQAKSLVDASSKANAELALLRVRTEHQVYELLTPEQRKQVAESRPAKGEMHGAHSKACPLVEGPGEAPALR